MPYDKKTWKRRYAERSDLSTSIVHLTRETKEGSPADVLYKIISSREIIGSSTSSGFIVGGTPAVCFQDAPLVSVCQNVFYEQKHNENNSGAKVRYRAIGMAFPKDYAYRKGARPVIYDKTSEAKDYLPEDSWWRIVNFDLSRDESIIDWTHEREWRSPGNFNFDLEETTLLFVTSSSYKAFTELCEENKTDYLSSVKGIVVMDNLLY
jgi:hypothetical protein